MPSMRDPATGRIVVIPDEQVEQAVRAGYEHDNPGAERARIAQDIVANRTAGLGAGVEAFIAGGLRGATLGVSDVAAAALGTQEDVDRLAELRRGRPGLSLAGEITGGVGAALATGGTGTLGSVARLTPGGASAVLGTRILGASEGAGTLARVGAGVAAGATEGALAGAGNYLTQVAIEDKPLAAEGFWASAAGGAKWGGVAGGALAAGERAFAKARHLFPKAQATREAVELAEREAVDGIEAAVRDGDAMDAVARRKLDEIVATKRATNPAIDAEIAAIERPPPPDLSSDDIGALISGRGRLRGGKVQTEAAPAAPPTGPDVDLEATLQRTLEQPQRAPRATGAKDPEQVRRLAMRDRAKETLAAAKRSRDAEAGIAGEAPAPAPATAPHGFSELADDEVIGFGKAFGQLDDEASKAAIRNWQTSSALQKNARTGGEAKANLTAMREQLERITQSGRLPRDVRLYRGVGPAFDSSALKPGSGMSSEGFLATSTGRDVAETFATLGTPKRGIAGTLFEIDAPAGSPSAWASSRPGEREVLFPRRTRLVVDSVREETVDEGVLRVVSAHVEPAPAAAGSRLERELAGTLETVRGGAPLGAAPHVARRQALDAIDEAVARLDPEAKVLVDAKRELEMSAAEIRDWVEAMRRRGGANTMKAAPRAGRGAKAVALRPTAAEAVAGTQPPLPQAPPAAADAVSEALRIPTRDPDAVAKDITESLGRYEAANANIAEVLGDLAPPSAVTRAKALREAQGRVVDAGARSTAEAAGDLERKATSGVLGTIGDIGAAYEVMRALGVPLPSPGRIPVIGPALSLYLKARAASTVFRRLGGRVPLTAEAMIAKGAAATRERVYRAVDSMVSAAPRAIRGARAAQAPRWVAVLGERLFDDGTKEPKVEGDGIEAEAQLVRNRVEELARAQQPGAVREVVRQKFPMADPAMVDELTASMEKRLNYLYQNAPLRPVAPTMLLGGRAEWTPSRGQITSFARRVEAADNPAGVLERAATSGDISIEAAETLRAVYPRLFGEAQMRLLERAAEMREALPYARRVMLSTLFDVPLDGTTDPEYVAFLQSAFAPPPAPEPAPSMAPAPTPSIAGDVRIGERTALRTDQPRR
jgi:hypothetical protein